MIPCVLVYFSSGDRLIQRDPLKVANMDPELRTHKFYSPKVCANELRKYRSLCSPPVYNVIFVSRSDEDTRSENSIKESWALHCFQTRFAFFPASLILAERTSRRGRETDLISSETATDFSQGSTRMDSNPLAMSELGGGTGSQRPTNRNVRIEYTCFRRNECSSEDTPNKLCLQRSQVSFVLTITAGEMNTAEAEDTPSPGEA